ncbi:MAG: copper resistance protein B, partial [Rhodospirillales bacterium]
MTKKSSTILLAAFLLAGFGQAEAEPLIWGVELEEFEYRLGEPSDVLAWDGNAVFGTDEWKLRLRSEAAYVIDANEYETLESQLLVQHPVSTFFDVKAGVRLDAPKGRDQWFGVVGIEGLAPQWLEVDANLFVSEEGDLSARLGLEYEL